MSLDYIITSPAVIDGTTSSNLSLEFGGDSINLSTPSSLLNTYDIVLPPNLGLQGQVLTLNSTLESIWTYTGIIDSFLMSSDMIFSTTGNFQVIPDTIITPPAGTYYCHFSAFLANPADCAIFLDGNIISSSFRDFDRPERSILSIITVATVNGGQNIDVRINAATVNNRTFVINKIG